MSVNGGPNISENGLIFSLDAADRTSYPGTGTAWNDLVGNNNSTLTNGPTFNSGNKGSIVFDGTNDYVNCGSSVGGGYINITACIWVYPQRNDNYYFARYILGSNGWIITSVLVGGNRVFTVDGREQGGGGNYFQILTTTSFPTNNIWYHLCYTKNANNWRLYVNGNLEANSNVGTGTIPFSSAGSDTLDIGGLSGDIYCQGRISNAQIYNRALSAQEILQNYNNTKSRFGL
jgi:hypothetical protein